MPLVPWLWGREGVRVLMQPPISTRSPATSIMTYSELDSKHLTVPRATIGETSAAQTTAAAVVPHLYQVTVQDAAFACVQVVHPCHPEVVASDSDPMVGDVVRGALLPSACVWKL